MSSVANATRRVVRGAVGIGSILGGGGNGASVGTTAIENAGFVSPGMVSGGRVGDGEGLGGHLRRLRSVHVQVRNVVRSTYMPAGRASQSSDSAAGGAGLEAGAAPGEPFPWAMRVCRFMLACVGCHRTPQKHARNGLGACSPPVIGDH